MASPNVNQIPISLLREYPENLTTYHVAVNEPFIEPEDRIRESYLETRVQTHYVRLYEEPFMGMGTDDESWPMGTASARFPVGADMPTRPTLTPLDDYRLVFDGSHAQ
jgi:hypothetical protein